MRALNSSLAKAMDVIVMDRSPCFCGTVMVPVTDSSVVQKLPNPWDPTDGKVQKSSKEKDVSLFLTLLFLTLHALPSLIVVFF